MSSEFSGRLIQATELLDCGELVEARTRLEALALEFPRQAEPRLNLGLLLIKEKRFTEAADRLEAVIRDHGKSHYALNFLGIAYNELDRSPEAIPLLHEAIRREPKYVSSYSNLAIAYRQTGQIERSVAYYAKALALEPETPDLHVNYALQLMSVGRYSEAVPHFAYRYADKLADKHGIKAPKTKAIPWVGQPLLNKRLLVLGEQGYGDSFQFIRFVRNLKNLGADVLVQVPREITPLLQRAFPDVTFLLPEAGEIGVHYWQFMMSVPGILGLDYARLPRAQRYLSPLSELLSRWSPQKEDTRLEVGLVWAGRPEHWNDHRRSLSLNHLESLFQLPGIRWLAVQKEIRNPADREMLSRYGIEWLGEDIESFEDTAAILDGVDLLISVDTSVAHLAGALGKPVWLLLPLAPDWRWQFRGGTSHWYPAMRLFRQKKTADWPAVVQELRDALSARLLLRGESCPLAAAALSNQAVAFAQTAQNKTALSLHNQALKKDGQHPGVLLNAGAFMLDQGEAIPAERLFAKAVERMPGLAEASVNLGFALLAQGKIAAGLQHYLARWASSRWPQQPPGGNIPRWQGESLAGKRLLIIPDQGFGDAILSRRLISLIVGEAATVVEAVAAPLLRLFAGNPIDGVTTVGTQEASGPFDYWTSPFDIGAYRLGDGDLPAAPYLRSESDAGQSPALPNEAKRKIGFCWRGSQGHPNEYRRCLAPETIHQIAGAADMEAWSLCKDAPLYDKLLLSSGMRWDRIEAAGDFLDTAKLMEGLDLVVTSDTAVAHLAGALGIATLLVLNVRDWRWVTTGNGLALWYPCVQVMSGGDSSVADIVAAMKRRLSVRQEVNLDSLHLAYLCLAPNFANVRSRLPLAALAAYPGVQVSYYEKSMVLPDLPVDQPKVLIVQRQLVEDADRWQARVHGFHAKGWAVVAEWDDHPNLFVPQIRAIFDGAPWASVKLADAVQTSTETLAEVIREVRGDDRVTVFDNRLLELPLVLPEKPSDKIRIFFGALNREQQARELLPVLQSVLDEHPHVELVVVHEKALFDALSVPNKVFYPALPYADYLNVLGTCHIALLPLGDSLGERCKSDIKFIEAGSLGVPCIASPSVYGETIMDGQTGLIAASPEAFGECLRRLIATPEECVRLGNAARNYVAKERMLASDMARRVAWYRHLWSEAIQAVTLRPLGKTTEA